MNLNFPRNSTGSLVYVALFAFVTVCTLLSLQSKVYYVLTLGTGLLVLWLYYGIRNARVLPLVIAGLFVFPILLSGINRFVTPVVFVHAAIVFSLAFSTMAAARSNKRSESDIYRDLSLGIAVGVAIAVVLYAADPSAYAKRNFYGRLALGTDPNVVGLVGLALVITVATVKSLGLKIAGALTGLTLMALASSRGSLVPAILVFALFPRTYFGSLRRAFTCAVILLASLCVAEVLSGSMVSNYVLNTVLAISDNDRGLGSGLTGRDYYWAATFNVWTQHPIFGVGFQQHSIVAGLPAYAHNMYLAILADLGLVGFIAIIGTFIGILFYALRGSGQRAKAVSVALVAYLIYGLFEARYVNVGNILSLAVLYMIFDFAGSSTLRNLNVRKHH